MIRNYLKIAFRNISKQRFYAFINILGLTIGLGTCLFILLYIQDELSYDTFHSKADRTHRVWIAGSMGGQEFNAAVSCYPFAQTAMAELPEVEVATHFSPNGSTVVKVGEQAFNQDDFLLADSLFFEVFDFAILHGEKDQFLKEPNTAVISRSSAIKLYGKENALGETFLVGNQQPRTVKVTGVIEDTPSNSHFDYDIIINENTWPINGADIWVSNNQYTYLVLHPEASPAEVEKKFRGFIEKYVGPQIEQFMGMPLAKAEENGLKYGYQMQPMTDIHLKSHLEAELKPGGDVQYLYIFGAVGVFILLIACVNFMNLATARSANRAKEVGIRKTLGSMRGELIGQFLSESLIYSLIAGLLALILVSTFIPSFNILAGKSLEFVNIWSPTFVMAFVGFILFVGVIAGSYPAFYLTSFQPVEVLKGKVRAGFKSSGIRSVLVVFQFVISITLIISTLLVYNQLEFIRSKKLGLDKDNILVVENGNRLNDKYETLKERIKQESFVENVASSSFTAFNVQTNTVFRGEGEETDHLLSAMWTDYDYVNTLKLEMKDGRYFQKEFASDTNAIILNEAAAKEMGWGDEAVGKRFTSVGTGNYTPTVVGIVKDFHWASLRNEIKPLVIFLSQQNDTYVNVRIQPGKAAEAVDRIASIWKEIAPAEPFQYHFLDEEFDELFRSEQRLGNISLVFTGMAIFIACLGLLGLAAFTAEQRTKEIGIRKVLGASVLDVLIMLNKEFTRLVLISFVISVPLAWYFADKWLSTFAYRIPVGVYAFAIAGTVTMLVAWLTVTYQSMRTAKGNPVTALKYE